MAESRRPKVRNCGTMVVHQRLLRADHAYAEARVASESRYWAMRTFAGSIARTGVVVIPVVVHVVWKTKDEDISDAQINSQIEVLNRDYRKKNGDIGKIPDPFAPLAADARVEFELTKITRTKTTKAYFIDDDGVKSKSTGGVGAWSTDKYLNIWVCQLAGGLLGYAQFPGGPSATDGVVILNTAFGTMGTAADPFNLGRTATHEVGHWLNLRHIWGDGDCKADDLVADTPNAEGPNTGKPTWPHVTCWNGPHGDMFMNYMDYVDDDTMYMFTHGQVARMRTSLDNDRPTLGHIKDDGDDGDVFDSLSFGDDDGLTGFEPAPMFLGGPIQTVWDLSSSQVPQFGALLSTATAPFNLSTARGSMGGSNTLPSVFHKVIQEADLQLTQYMAIIDQYVAANRRGQLSDQDRVEAERLYSEYLRISNDFQQRLSEFSTL